MATDQFNVRLRDGLDRQVRVRAAELGCKPRDVIEEALVAAGFARVSIDPARLTSTAPAPPAPASPPLGAALGGPPAPEEAGGCPECGGEMQLVDDSRDGKLDQWMRCEDCGLGLALDA